MPTPHMFTATISHSDMIAQELFSRIGPVSKLNLRYDRAGRSEGTAYVTYDRKEHAEEAVRQFDGANANGQYPETRHLTIEMFCLTSCSRPANQVKTVAVAQPVRHSSDARAATRRASLEPGRQSTIRVSPKSAAR